MRRATCDLCGSAHVDNGRISICMQTRPREKRGKEKNLIFTACFQSTAVKEAIKTSQETLR